MRLLCLYDAVLSRPGRNWLGITATRLAACLTKFSTATVARPSVAAGFFDFTSFRSHSLCSSTFGLMMTIKKRFLHNRNRAVLLLNNGDKISNSCGNVPQIIFKNILGKNDWTVLKIIAFVSGVLRIAADCAVSLDRPFCFMLLWFARMLW